jgi:6-phosphofructokinase 1
MHAQVLAHNAVHAAFAGYTGVTVGLVNTHYVYLPIPVVIQAPRRVRMRAFAHTVACRRCNAAAPR